MNLNTPATVTDADMKLLDAAADGRVDDIQQALAAEADVDVIGGQWWQSRSLSAIVLSAGRGYTDCVQALINAGAVVEAVTEDGRNAMDLAFERGHSACMQVLQEAEDEMEMDD